MVILLKDKYYYGFCGVFYEICPTGNVKISELSSQPFRLIKDSYEWVESSVDFSFEDLRKNLNWLTKEKCLTCFHIEELWCDMLKCEKAKRLQNCLIYDEFLQCPSIEYHRDRYPFLIEHFNRVKEIGLEKHPEKERIKAKKQ